MLKIDDLCVLTIDWADDDIRGKRVQIVGKQDNGGVTYYKVLWRSREAFALKEKYGNLFTAEELKKVS